MKRSQPKTSEKLTDEERETINALLHYPSLDKVFDQNEPQSLVEMKQKMRSTITELERVVRRGSQTEAEKAARIIEAYQTTLRFLDELERRRNSQPA